MSFSRKTLRLKSNEKNNYMKLNISTKNLKYLRKLEFVLSFLFASGVYTVQFH